MCSAAICTVSAAGSAAKSGAAGCPRALKIEKILHFIQAGEGRTPCIGFGG